MGEVRCGCLREAAAVLLSLEVVEVPFYSEEAVAAHDLLRVVEGDLAAREAWLWQLPVAEEGGVRWWTEGVQGAAVGQVEQLHWTRVGLEERAGEWRTSTLVLGAVGSTPPEAETPTHHINHI